jgi:DEAD_2.
MDRDYSFPLRPYNVQIDFMNNLYECLSNCKGGIFESPTGTGKTLSIICASLTFLFDYHEGLLTDILNPNNSKKFKHDFSGKTIKDLQTMILSNCPILFPKKILYLTRTHSQLDQFVGELKKTKWASTEKVRVVRLGSRSQFCIHETVSKNKNLIEFNCKRMTKFVDPDQSEEENNEEEKKIQNYSIFGNFPTKVKKKSKKPEPMRILLQQDNMKQFLLDNVCDIEDLVTAGHRLMGCPYFGTRSAIKEADLILAPYSSVFNKHTRHSVGIDLKDCFVIVDESHNINQAITDMHSASISKKQLINSEKSIKAYYTAFVDGMNPRKLMFVKKAIKIVEKLKGFIRTNENLTNKTEERDSFLRSLEIDDIDFFYL